MNTQPASSSPTLVLLHAFPLTSAMWEPQHLLAEHIPIHTPDFPGFGAAPGLDEEQFSMKLCARLIGEDLETRGIERAVICGLSMGGYVAFECWRLFPERIAGIILADTKASPDNDEGRRKRYDAVERIGRGEYAAYLDELFGSVLSEKTVRDHPEVKERIHAIASGVLPESAIAALLGMAARADSSDLLPSITVPTALIFGEDDRTTTVEEGKAMASALPDARLRTIAGAGHLSNMERPDEFNDAVMEACERMRVIGGR